ncbi:hypothetical protein ACFLV3_02145 [Chloroflexota bacterium]
MIKRFTIYAIPEGRDAEEWWDYHINVHAVDIVNAAGPGLKKYLITRIKEATMRTDNIFGKQRYFAYNELWFENEETMNKSYNAVLNTKLPNGKTVSEDFWSRLSEGFTSVVEEHVIKDTT